MKDPSVFIILLNWNNWDDTQRCLESLNNITYSNFEVVVVDNNSSTEEKNTIKNFQSSQPRLAIEARRAILNFQTKLIWNESNLGFAGGNNVGIKFALEQGADHIMLLNNDTVVAPDFLSELILAAGSEESYGILGSRIYKHGSDEIVFDGGKVNFCLTKGGHIAKLQILNSKFPSVDYITGAAMLVKREVIEKIGLMREEYFLYYEDVDWCLRARRAGYKCVLVPTSKVWHKVSATTKEGSPSYIYYHTRNALMLARFNGNIIQKAAAYLTGAWILLKQIPKFFLVPRNRVWAISMTRGVWDFYRKKYGKY